MAVLITIEDWRKHSGHNDPSDIFLNEEQKFAANLSVLINVWKGQL